MRILILALLLSSCSSVYHLKKAVKKDPSILQEQTITDTLKISTIDSIPYIVNDTIEYKYFKTFTDTIIKTKYNYIDIPKTRQEIRLEKKSERKQIKEESKTNRLDKRLDKRIQQTDIRKKNGGWRLWIFLLIIGSVIGVLLSWIIRVKIK